MEATDTTAYSVVVSATHRRDRPSVSRCVMSALPDASWDPGPLAVDQAPFLPPTAAAHRRDRAKSLAAFCLSYRMSLEPRPAGRSSDTYLQLYFNL